MKISMLKDKAKLIDVNFSSVDYQLECSRIFIGFINRLFRNSRIMGTFK